ncbi:MAG TPA: hypothetical protein VMR98_01600 [Candidatus Polarisedimenticolaceae bacterium]|nr:hypothetical protein [Candidatus Polarisedimenticolaceae bacterium]
MNAFEKFMKSPRALFVLGMLCLIAVQVPHLLEDPNHSTYFMLGAAAASIICLGPGVWVKATKQKFKSAKPKYVEPHPFGSFALTYLPVLVGSVLVSMMVAGIFHPQVLSESTNFDIFLGAFAFFFGLLLPMGVYFCWEYLTHKRIIEFNTAEWNKLKRR